MPLGSDVLLGSDRKTTVHTLSLFVLANVPGVSLLMDLHFVKGFVEPMILFTGM